MSRRVFPVLLSGGAGTRLWPLSREQYPKQLIPLFGDKTLLQQTAERANRIRNVEPPIVVCNQEHRFLIAEQLRQVDIAPSSILLEPVGRNTAPAAAIGALQAQQTAASDDAVILVLPSDHIIKDEESFAAVARSAVAEASAGRLVTFGIRPTRPETGYGYVLATEDSIGSALKVKSFVEKPDLETAKRYLEAGGFYWNSGMFAMRADVYLHELARSRPDIEQAARKAFEGACTDLDFVRLDEEAFCACRADSIDYAVMEKTDRAVVFPLDVGWNDVGSWSAVWEESDHDADRNSLSGDVVAEDTRNCLVHGSNRLVTTLGLDDLVIVDTEDALLVADKQRVQDVRTIVARLKEDDREEVSARRKVYRPWGTYETIDRSDRYRVKKITVNPGQELSLQVHHHRAEHWVVVSGTAKVTRGNEEYLVAENQSTHISLGEKHRLANLGKIPVELIEVQVGSYLGEDDITRFDDRYGR